MKIHQIQQYVHSFIIAAFILGAIPSAFAQNVERESLNSEQIAGDNHSFSAAISSDGRFVAFYSEASNLVSNDTNNLGDVFLRDRNTGFTYKISQGLNGAEANGVSFNPSISADGRFITFESAASNLVASDTNDVIDVFVFDRNTKGIERVSVGTHQVQSNGESSASRISGSGYFVVFTSKANNLVIGDTNNFADVFVRNLRTHETVRASVNSQGENGDGPSTDGAISDDGRYVAFSSLAGNFSSLDTNENSDVFVHDLKRGRTVLISVSLLGVSGNESSWASGISGNGHLIAFRSDASNLVVGDMDNKRDAFVRDLVHSSTECVSVDPESGEPFGGDLPAISADGHFVAFERYFEKPSLGPDWDVKELWAFHRMEQFGEMLLKQYLQPPGLSMGGNHGPSISKDGNFIGFESLAINLVPGDINSKQDIFLLTR